MMKKIIWRLKEQPTSKMLQELVSSGILNKDEAREILFNETDESERSIESLKQEIKFLRELIEKLSNRTQIVEVIKEIRHTYEPHYWYQPYQSWTSGTNCFVGPMETATNGNITVSNANFSDISTF